MGSKNPRKSLELFLQNPLEKNFENMEVLFLQANVGEKELVTKFKLSKPLLSNPGKLIQKILPKLSFPVVT